MFGKKVLFDNETIVRGVYEMGVKVSAAYPGTPSVEANEALVQYDEVYAEWTPNGKAAIEVATGVSIARVCSMYVMRHVGTNVATDSPHTVAHTGVRGGMVLVVMDNPGIYSSQNEQDSRVVARAAMVPVVEPSDSVGVKEFMKCAYDLSEKYDTLVLLRNTIRLSHSQGVAELGEWAKSFDIPYEGDVAKHATMPGNAIKRHLVVEARMKRLALDANELPISRVEYNDLSVGFITNDIVYQYVKEVVPEVFVSKLGLVNPLLRELIGEFALEVDKPYILEELESVVEEQVKVWGTTETAGKEILTVQGKHSADLTCELVLGQISEMDKAAQVSVRPLIPCLECPHRGVYTVLNKLKIHMAGDIGCYTLGAAAPLSVIDTTIRMGTSINTLYGMGKTKGKDYIHNRVAVIGGSTFMRTGINSLINMVYNQVTGVVIIPDNSIAGMAGHQEHATTGKTLKG